VITNGRSLAPRIAVVVLGLALGSAAAPEPRAAAAAPSPRGVDLSAMDRSVRPGDDFFAYANGSWLKKTEIPPDRAAYGVGAAMTELAAQRTAALIKEAAARQAPAGSEARKIADYYASFMDEAGIEAKGTRPLDTALEDVARIEDRAALARALGGSLRTDVDVLNATQLHTSNLFGLWVAQDLDDPARYSPFLLQGGLGMPDREYYLDPSPRMADIRTKYQRHIAAVLKLEGVADAEAKAARIFELEHHIAETHVSRADSEDVAKGNNHWTRQDFATRAPGLDWPAFFAAAGLEAQPVFVVWQPGAVTGISRLVGEEPLETWKDYLSFREIEHASPFLPKAFAEENFDFYRRVLTGTPRQRDRWKRAVDTTNAALGEAVGKLYARRFFPPSEKARAREMVRNLLTAFSRRIDRLDWMAPQTKARAKAKLAALRVGVGYPDRWRDYSGLTVVRGDALGNARRAEIFEYGRNLKKLGQPVDRGEWVMTPQTVNAVNLPAMNALNFPAAILQPPRFDSKAPAALNYGATGATIGHEISHSFDDQGALFDESGKLANWWTKEDFAHFQSSAAALVEQYDRYRPFPDLAVHGKQTLSENIADVAGLAAAHDAYKLSLGGKPAPAAGGLSGDQQFFLAFAQSWRTKIREPALRQRILTDGHAPPEYRADTVRNLDAWYGAFDVKPGEALYLAPADRVRIW
jgi:predicted metalloendopeptidase